MGTLSRTSNRTVTIESLSAPGTYRMNFSLWLIAVVIATINAVPLSEIEDQDYATELPNISDIVDMKIVTEEPLESDIESVTEVVVLDDETTVNSSSEDIITFDDLESIESPDPSIQVFQEVRKLWDLPNEGEFPSDEDNLEAQLKQEELELNEVANNLGDDDIVDVISNFIADKDPMLQVSVQYAFASVFTVIKGFKRLIINFR